MGARAVGDRAGPLLLPAQDGAAPARARGRRDQSADRARTEELDWDERHGLWKANPLATWTERDVWAYIERHDLPYNPLHDQGYSSIGCTHCTLPGAGRDGRWAGLEKTECGMHAPVPAARAG
jgi:phosphoadenylyl-sulfate reductase (thioredoxin)